MAIKVYAFNGFVPGAPNGQILSETPADALENGGVAISALPANGTYFSDSGGQSTYTGTPTVAHWENSLNWDSVKNFKFSALSSDLGGRKLEVVNYVHVDVNLTDPGSSGGTNDNVLIDGAKRGSVSTGGGHDTIEIGGTSNTDQNPGFSDRFGVDSGSGNDIVIFRPASAGAVKNSPYTNYSDGHSTSTLVDLGSGNDKFDSTGNPTLPGATSFLSADSVFGGSGNDTILTGENNDTIDGDSANDYIVAGGEGAFATVSGGASSFGPELVANGGFEADALAAGSFVIGPVTNWQSNIGGGIELQDHYPGLIGAHGGDNHAELDSTGNSNAFQDLATGGTGQFVLDFWYSPRDNVPTGDNTVEVYWNNVLLDTIDGGPTSGWSEHSYTVTGGGATTRLEFRAAGTSNSVGGFIDDVSVKGIIPAPGVVIGDDDLVNGGSGNDTIYGGHGNDTIDGGSGSDSIYGGSGNDDISGGAGSGSDYIDGGEGNDTISSESGSETVLGGAGNDIITGTSGSDKLDGGNDNDSITGGSGSDTIVGGAGYDTINGGTGNDQLTGGADNDVFVFGNDGASSKETILDFQPAVDHIDVTLIGVTAAWLDTNNDGFINTADSHVNVSGGNIDVNLGGGDHVIVKGFTQLIISDFFHA